MEDKKAKFIVFIVVGFIALICSSAVYGMTGGLSDWIVASVNDNEDANNNGILDSSEGNYYSSDSNYYSSSDDDPDFLARLLRSFMGFDSGQSYDSSYYSSNSYDSGDDGFSILMEKGKNKVKTWIYGEGY